MKKLQLFVIICAACLLAFPIGSFGASEAEPDELIAPQRAILSPNGGRLEVTQKVRVRKIGDKPFVQFVLPADAANLQITIPGRTIARWSSTPVLMNEGHPLAGRRSQVEKERTELTAQLMTVNSRLALWQNLPKSANPGEVTQLQSVMQEAMPALALQQASLERRLKLVNEELSRMPQASSLAERIRVLLIGDIAEGEEITVNYSYNHDSCGWEAIYDFNARPEEGSGDMIAVRFLAEVWQFTGIDWRNTEITLATKGFGPREPAPLAEWIVDSAKSRPQPRPAPHAKMAAPLRAEAAMTDAAPVAGHVEADTDTIYAIWTLAERGLPQGRSRLQITSAAWRAPLQWIARPTNSHNQVWLEAKYDLPQNQAWPAGLAEYSVDNQSVGVGEFRPRSGEATLYFGSDPRVSITTTTDAYKRGHSGFINNSKTWTWSWIYTIYNQHNKPIQVRVERPAPQIVDQDVTVSYKNNPPAKEDAQDHSLYWVVTVPAHGKTAIEHGVTLSSPTKLPLMPDIP